MFLLMFLLMLLVMLLLMLLVMFLLMFLLMLEVLLINFGDVHSNKASSQLPFASRQGRRGIHLLTYLPT